MISKRIIVIGGGAAGYFAAINIAEKNPDCNISILEKSNKVLAKVRISGGGRCNVTNHCFDLNELLKNYPRGNKELRQVFSRFAVTETIKWFESHGVKLKTEADQRMFPVTDSSETIIECFTSLTKKLKIDVQIQTDVFAIRKNDTGFELKTSKGILNADAVICATGGHPKAGAYDLLKNLGHTIDAPIPSLFTINLPEDQIRKELQGISVEQAEVSIQGTKLKYAGPVLITHWGLSGPAVLKLSAFAAHEFFEKNYEAKVLVNWVYPLTMQETSDELLEIQNQRRKALPASQSAFGLPKRLWEYLLNDSGIHPEKPWAEQNKKILNKLAENLCRSTYHMKGKTTFKEEFVTCGGVNLKEIDFTTMQSKVVPGLYFCGEVMNIDGITGGFNFQSAWSTAWLAANSIGKTPPFSV